MAFRPFRRLGLKIASVVLAALIWLIVSGEQIVERGFRIPLEFSNLPSQLELAGDAPSLVDVRVRGSSGALGRLTPGELVAILDLRQAKAGPRLFHLSGSDVRAPFGVDVVQVTPSSLAITCEPSASKQVSVSPVVEGEAGATAAATSCAAALRSVCRVCSAAGANREREEGLFCLYCLARPPRELNRDRFLVLAPHFS